MENTNIQIGLEAVSYTECFDPRLEMAIHVLFQLHKPGMLHDSVLTLECQP